MTTRTITPISLVSEVLKWEPQPKAEIKRLLDSKKLTKDEKASVQESAVSILGQGVDPNKPHEGGGKTGLVIGRVQSGKTLSFTSVAALARDNGFRMVIAITGTSIQLFEQSLKRFRKDLQIDGEEGYSRWQLYPNPKNEALFAQHLETAAAGRHTVLVVVMKHFKRLSHLSNLLNSISAPRFPTLIIDDEGDQASLNTGANKNVTSATYSEILKLRESVKPCTFLQYTATPQAPLLISTVDQLSPDYVHLLKPGEGYMGGAEIFKKRKSQLVRLIDDAHINRRQQKPPESLRCALRLYLLGVAAGLLEHKLGKRILRSMLVHPSTSQERHETYKVWVDAIIDDWKGTLSRTNDDSAGRKSLEEKFAADYEDLKGTVAELPSFGQLWERVPEALDSAVVEIVNAIHKDNMPIWERHHNWILVGGKALDRGVTLEGLTVSYISRDTYNSNADTVQQMARFFGYKQDYIGYCRLFLNRTLCEQLVAYVDHEESLLEELQDTLDRGIDIKTWPRRFRLSKDLNKPCRRNVVAEFIRGSHQARWVRPQYYLGPVGNTDSTNLSLIEKLLSHGTMVPHLAAGGEIIHRMETPLPLKLVYDQLLSDYSPPGWPDAAKFLGAALQINHYLQQEESAASEECGVYVMNPPRKNERHGGSGRFRSLNKSGRISNLFQGRNPGDDPRYKGDNCVRLDIQKLSIQVHYLDLGPDKSNIAYRRVPFLAIWMPAKLKTHWLAQFPEQHARTS